MVARVSLKFAAGAFYSSFTLRAPPVLDIKPFLSEPEPATTAAAAANNDIAKKGRWKRINAQSSILLRCVDMRRVDHKRRQRTAKAVVNALRQFGAVRRAEKVEIS